MPDDLNTLADLTPSQLRERWKKLGVRGDPPHFKQALLRDIAWHIQQRTRGGLDAETRRRLRAATRNAPNPTSARGDPVKRKRRERIPLRTGATLVRTWRGRRHEVTVLDDGKRFRYRDAEYASLSEIAREITGARWSGPRFFGLKKLRGAA
ncbi:MAG: DUF2924 domain-containing protein [Phycisphaeraceae bacterium]|nr:DUF2924 domain-containing protein [Phycisphaeraceae bacterium]